LKKSVLGEILDGKEYFFDLKNAGIVFAFLSLSLF